MNEQQPPSPPALPALQLVADPTKYVGASIKRQRIGTDVYGHSNGFYGTVVGDSEVVLGMMVANVPHNGNYNPQTGRHETVYSPELIFVVAKHPDTALQQALAEAQAAKDRQEYTTTKYDAAAAQAVTAQGTIAELERQIALEKSEREAQTSRAARLAETVRKMETDLGKVRQYVGDKAFKEAVGD